MAASEVKEVEPICRVLEPLSDYCEMSGDIRIQGKSSTIFVVVSPQAQGNSSFVGNKSWIIQPYPRKGSAGAMKNVRKWTVKLVAEDTDVPKCSSNHTVPAVLFSTGGYRGNHFHDFADLIIPIYSTSQQFNGEVKFLATDYAPWWISKFKAIVSKLSNHEVIPIDKKQEIHCFPSMVAGLKCHKELDIDPSKFPNALSMNNFRQFLRKTYSLERTKAIRPKKGDGKRPRLMIISRSKTRILINEREITKMAKRLGFEVVIAEANHSSNLTRFAEEVNSCDVLMGIHGAGLTNMVFLPDNAVLIQIVPLGAIEGFARNDFGKPSNDMNIRYLEYKIKVSESSLIQKYPLDHAVFRDPFSIHRQGWMEIRKTYLDNQDVKIDLRRFRPTLVKALRVLKKHQQQ